MKGKTYSDVNRFLNASLRHKEEYLIEVDGLSMWIHPQVISPRYSHSPLFMKNKWDIKKNMKVLDMGTGSGILAIFAALQGAKEVAAVDINPYACEVAAKNFKLNHLDEVITTIQSDLFEYVNGMFDRIIFNAPHWNKEVDKDVFLTYAVYDRGYEIFRRFLSQAKEHLEREGKILVGFRLQSDKDMELFESHISEEGYKVEKRIQQNSSHVRLLYYLSLK